MGDVQKQKILTKRNIRKAIENPRGVLFFIEHQIERLLGKHDYDDYTEYYLDRIDRFDPDDIVGEPERFDRMAEWQFELLKEHGLEPGHTLLDLGCGVLRAGLNFVEYLDAGHYYGMDINDKALERGRERLEEAELDSREPVLINNEDLTFEEAAFDDIEFDYILAQSVLTHLPPDHIEECLQNISKVMHDDSVFIATFHRSEDEIKRSPRGISFRYPTDYLESQCQQNGLEFHDLQQGTPNDQHLMKITKE